MTSDWWGLYDSDDKPCTMEVVTEGFVMQPGFVPRRELETSSKSKIKKSKHKRK